MRKYIDKKAKEVKEIYCNCCGKKMEVVNGVVKEGVLCVDNAWGYFSEKDGQIHSFDICESCYDKFIKNFKHPIDVVKQKELL